MARLLADAGYDGPLIAAAYLHDAVEKTEVEIDEIRQRFGPVVAEVGTSLAERIELWEEDVKELHALDPGTPFVDEMESELDALRAEA